MQRLNLYTEQGGVTLTTGGISSSTKVMGVFPGATCSVFNQGTLVLSTIYSDNGITPKSNPFTSDSITGLGFFLAANGHYDLQFSGTGFSTFTLADIILNDPTDANTLGSLTVTGNATIGGNLTATAGQNQLKAYKFNSVLWVDGIKYTTIAAAYADAVAGGMVCVPPNYTETLAANLVLNKKNTVIQFMGACTITQGAFIVQVSQGADNISIISPFVHSSDQAGNLQGCSFTGYTGAAAAIDIGSSAGFTYNTFIRGININLAAAQANAIGIRRTNGVAGPLEYCEVVFGPVSGQVGFKFIGTGAFFDGTSNLVGLELNSSALATNNIGIQFTGVNQNGYVFVGGHANMGGSANGSVCIDAGAGSSKIDLGGFCADVAATGLTVESTVNTAVRGWFIIDSGVTTYANFGAGSLGNVVWSDARSISSQLVVDNGTAGTNSVTNGVDIQWNSRRWGVVSEAGGTGFQIIDKSDNSQAIAKGVSGATHIDSSAGNPVRTNQNSGAGVEFWNAGASVLTIDAAGTMHPGVAGAVGLGTTALPFLNVFMGTAATNNFKFQPAATTGARIITVADPLSPTTVGLPLTIASGTSTLTVNAALGAVTSQAAITTAATGALTTDAIEWSYATAPTAGDSLCHVSPYVTAANVNFVRTNPTAAAQSVSAIVINWRVIR